MNFTISDLRQQPAFFDTVADRIWRAWWREKNVAIDYIVSRLRENMNAEMLPFALVAHDGENFLGTASVIASDLDERPLYTPWVAAVWVDPQYRKQQVGRALVARAVGDAMALGVGRTYLCASESHRNFYVRQGWEPIEAGVGDRRLVVFIKKHPG